MAAEPLDDVRYLLERTVIVDPRPEWVGWARDQLGTHPNPGTAGNEPFEEFPSTVPVKLADPIEEFPAGDPGPVLPDPVVTADPGPAPP